MTIQQVLEILQSVPEGERQRVLNMSYMGGPDGMDRVHAQVRNVTVEHSGQGVSLVTLYSA
jgi:hypothetical protein